MLQIIRDKTSGLIAMVIVALLIVTFAFWGVSYYFDQGGSVVVVSVNDSEIELGEYQRVYQNVRRQWQELLNDSAGNVDDELVKQQTLDSLIERELVRQMNESMNLQVGVQQVREVINGIQAFHGLNGFDNSVYERAVAQIGFTTVGFERQIQQDMKGDHLQNSLTTSEFITDKEVRLLASLKNQSRNISYSIISSNTLKDTFVPTEEEISSFYENNSRDFLEPEQVKIAYLELSIQKLASEIEVNEDDLLSYYETNKADYDVEDQRKIRHITIKIEDKASEERIGEISSKAEELIALLEEDMTFDELSDKYSNDSEFKIEVSELGFLIKGIMDAEVDEVMFSMVEGELSAPIVTKNSVDVVKVEKIKGGQKNTFENVQEDVLVTYSLSLAENEYYEASEQLANLSYEHPDTLENAAEALGLEIRESDFFNRISQADPLLSDSNIISASFSEEVLNGNNSEVIEVGDNRVVALRLIEHKSEQKKPLDKVRESVITRMKYEQASTVVRRKGETVLEKLKNGGNPEELAEEYSIEWRQTGEIRRDHSGINPSVLQRAFQLGRNDEGLSLFGGMSLESGDYALIIVNSVNDPDAASFTKKELDPIRSQLEQLKAAGNWRQLVKDVRNAATVNIFSDRL